MENVKKTIFVNTSFEGIHCYPSAPEGVEFLRTPHRHIFGVRVEIEVYHNDRELEFILLKRKINSWFEARTINNVWQMGALSCERVASDLIAFLQRDLDKGQERYMSVSVDEDGENGATVEVTPTKKEPKKIWTTTAPMTMNWFQEKAYTNIQEHKSHQEEVMHWAIGLGEEAGETLSVIKHKYYGGGYDIADLVGELGDTLWHIAALCSVLGLDMEDVATYNIAKLHHRHPSTEFDYSRSFNRKELGKQFRSSEECKALLKRIEEKQNERL